MQKCTEENTLKSSTRDFLKVPLKISLQFKITKHIEKNSTISECSVQLLSRVRLLATPWTSARQASLSITNSRSPPKHVHQVGDAIQPSHPRSSPSPPAFNLSQHQGLFLMSHFFASGGQSIGVSASASVLPMNIQDWSPLEWTGWISLQSKGLSRVFSNTTI